MRFLVDAQLPPSLSRWLSTHGKVAWHVALDLSPTSTDRAIVAYAISHDAVIITKDLDFLDLVSDPPPQLVHVDTGNISNAALIQRFEVQFDDALERLMTGQAVVTIA